MVIDISINIRKVPTSNVDVASDRHTHTHFPPPPPLLSFKGSSAAIMEMMITLKEIERLCFAFLQSAMKLKQQKAKEQAYLSRNLGR